MIVLKIALESLKSRKLSIGLAIASIALSSSLFLGIEKIRSGVRTSFSQTISGTDLIVGPRSSSINVLLNTIFQVGIGENLIRYETFLNFKNHPLVKWAVPLSFGDNYRGHRVIGTTTAFFDRYKYRNKTSLSLANGKIFRGVKEAVIGSLVAQKQNLTIGDKIILAHGLSEQAMVEHDEDPFVITGVLKRTNTPLDRSIFISLQGMAVIHEDSHEDSEDSHEHANNHKDTSHSIEIEKVSAFFLACKSRIDVLVLQRKIAEYQEEPLSASLPGMTLLRLWKMLGNMESALFAISLLTALVSLLSMLIAVLTSLQQRRREIAVLRALGAGPFKIFWLLILESVLLAVMGLIFGFITSYGLLFLFQGNIETMSGVFIALSYPGKTELVYAGSLLFLSIVLGLIPGTMAYRMTLRDGLTMKV